MLANPKANELVNVIGGCRGVWKAVAGAIGGGVDDGRGYGEKGGKDAVVAAGAADIGGKCCNQLNGCAMWVPAAAHGSWSVITAMKTTNMMQRPMHMGA
jgi:hypothetical protein